MSSQRAVNNYITDYVSPDLKWYERDGLLTYINQLKYLDFSKDPDQYLKSAKVVNFEIIHVQCTGDGRNFSDKHYQTVCESSLKNIPQIERKRTLAACLRFERKDLYVEKKISFDYFRSLCKDGTKL